MTLLQLTAFLVLDVLLTICIILLAVRINKLRRDHLDLDGIVRTHERRLIGWTEQTQNQGDQILALLENLDLNLVTTPARSIYKEYKVIPKKDSCGTCKGEGYVFEWISTSSGPYRTSMVCSTCAGTGKVQPMKEEPKP